MPSNAVYFLFDHSSMRTRAEHRTGGPGVLSCRTGCVFYFCPVLPPARTKVGSRTGRGRAGQKMFIRAEHRTGGPGVPSCPVGQDAFLSCPAARQDEGGKQNRTKNLVLCSPLMRTKYCPGDRYLWNLPCIFFLECERKFSISIAE